MDERKSFLVSPTETIGRHLLRHGGRQGGSRARSRCLGRLLRWFLPNGGTLVLVALLVVTAQVWAKPLVSPAGAPGPSATTVDYQGWLADSDGSPLDGTYEMTFSLWDAATGGGRVWGPESHAAVPVSRGLFSVGLGSETLGGIPTSMWNGDRYLEATVGGETLSPRVLIRSAPVAGMALTVPDGAITSAKHAIATFYGEDNTFVRLQGLNAEMIVSEFHFSNVPAGEVEVTITLIGRVEPGARQEGMIWLEIAGNRSQHIPTHALAEGRYTQLTLHGRVSGFSGGTLTVRVVAGSENADVNVGFGVLGDDYRFGRHITVVAGL